MSTFSQIIIFALPVIIGLALLTFLFSAFNVPKTLPTPVTNAIITLFRLLNSFDFLLPIATIYQLIKLYFLTLIIQLSFKGVIGIHNMILSKSSVK